MKYMILINLGPEARNWQSLPEDEQKKIAAAWGAVNQTPGITPGDAAAAARDGHHGRARTTARSLTTDGPFIETKEALGGYLRLRGATTSTRPSSWRARSRPLQSGGSIEVRPIVEWSAILEATSSASSGAASWPA